MTDIIDKESNENSKEQKLLNTAFNLFTKKGVKDTSIQEIVDEANVGKGTFYLYFKDKYEISDILIARKSKKLFNDALKKLKKQQFNTLTEQIIFIVDYIIDELTKNQLLLKFITKNLSLGVYNTAVNNLYEENEQDENGIYNLFLKGIHDHKINLENPYATLYMIVELTGSSCFNSILYNEPLPIKEYKPYLYKAIASLINE